MQHLTVSFFNTLRLIQSILCVAVILVSVACDDNDDGTVQPRSGARIDCASLRGGCGDTSVPKGSIRMYTNGASSTPNAPDVILSGPGALMSMWKRSETNMNEVLYESRDGTARVRSFFDRDTNEPRLVVDEFTGESTIFFVDQGETDTPSRIVMTFNGSGNYTGGFVTYMKDDVPVYGKIGRAPSFTGQLVGQLVSDLGGQSGSFTIVANAGGEPNTIVPTEELTTSVGKLYLNNVQPISSGVLGFSEAISYPDRYRLQRSSEGMELGQVSRALSLPSVLQGAGVVIGVAGLLTSSPALALAGSAMVVAGLFSNDIADSIERNFSNDNPIAGPAVNLLVDSLRNGSGGIVSRVQNLVNKVENVVAGVGNTVDRIGDRVSQIGNRLSNLADSIDSSGWDNLSDTVSFVGDTSDSDFGNEPSSGWENIVDEVRDVVSNIIDNGDQLIADVIENVTGGGTQATGQAVFQDGTIYELNGIIDTDGTVSINGMSEDGDTLNVSGTIDEDGNYQGDYDVTDAETGETDQGSSNADVSDIGACSDSQGSGGQGAFTYAHFLGEGPGSVTLFVDAYSIPDAFTVSGPGGLSYTTGGLISGSRTITLTTSQLGPIIAFVSVSAPEDGTSWEYSIGCL